MSATYCKMRNIMDNALSAFLETECSLIFSVVSEPNICQRMSIYLQQAANASGFGDYFADTECNRKQDGEIKTIIDKRDVVVNIRCDLLLHGRGEMGPQENLIAIEVKKAGRPPEEFASDRNRLVALTRNPSRIDNEVWPYGANGAWPEHVCGYILGAYVILDGNCRHCTIEYYDRGRLRDRQVSNF